MAEAPTAPVSRGGQLQPVVAALPVPDDELVRRAQSGKTEAFEELVRRHERKVYNIAYRMLGNPEDASEALQDTFLRAYRFLGRFEFKSQFYTWIYRIATNVSLTKLRRRKSPVVMSLDQPVGDSGDMAFEIPDDQFSPDLLYRRRELQRKLQQAVEELPEDYRTVVVLRDLEGLSNEEVSKVLNLTVAAVKSRLHRGRLALRSKLENHL